MSRGLYTFAWLLLLPLALLRLLWRSRREAGYRRGVAERFAAQPDAERFRGAWWIHAVSVGETRAAQPLVEALLAREPGARVLLTQMTPTGRRTADELYAHHGSRVRTAYLPYDLPWLVRRFLRRFEPRAAILMETEIWPNLVFAAQAQGLPLILANARLSERSARRYARLGGFARDVFGSLTAVAAQSADDAVRLASLGALNPQISGNLKFEVQPGESALATSALLRERVGQRRVLLAASTREGEEAPILQAFATLAGERDLLLLVPRHPQRFEAVARLASEAGLALQRRSAEELVQPGTRVLLGDSMGEMFAYYALAEVALIGGSWAPLGGQNLIEACAVGTPVVVGPHTFNFSEATRLAIEAGAAVRTENPSDAMREALAIIDDEQLHGCMSAAGREFAQAHRGATARTLAVIDHALEANPR